MKKLLTAINQSVVKERTFTPGVHKLNSWKFYLALFCCCGSMLALIQDEFFHQYGTFVWERGIIPILLAWFLCTSYCWENMLFGKPSGANLLLQILIIIPATIFTARILTAPTSLILDDSSILDQIGGFLKDSGEFVFGKNLFNIIPEWLTDIFRNWKLTIITLLLLLILSFKNITLKCGFTVLIILIPFFTVFAHGMPSIWFLFGTALLICTAALLFCRYDKVIYYENITYRLQSKNNMLSPLFIQAVMKTMTELADKENISSERFSEITGEYVDSPEPEKSQIIAEIEKRTVKTYALLTIEENSRGRIMKVDPKLFFNENSSLLRAAAIAPRMIATLIFVLVWIAMPLDILPDSLPVVGVLDDVAAGVIGWCVTKNSLEDF